MKKLLLFAAVAVFAFTNVNAQEVKYGVKAGVNFASIGGDSFEGVSTSSLTAFHVGGVAEIVISEKFSVQPELLYSSQGGKREYSETDGDFTFSATEDVKLDYISLPIMAKYYVAEGFSIEAGPQISFLTSAKVDFEETFEGQTESGSEDIKDSVKSTDFGLGIGAGYKMDSGLNFALRYNLGLSNANDGEGSDEFKNQNNVFQVSVGYMF